jgi:hypothetical protein
MAALIVIALFWGNCFSCPQVLLALSSHQPAHGCCHRTKPATADCQTQSLRSFVKADMGVHAPSALAVVSLVQPQQHSSPSLERTPLPLPAVHAPPDLLSLNSTFRI